MEKARPTIDKKERKVRVPVKKLGAGAFSNAAKQLLYSFRVGFKPA